LQTMLILASGNLREAENWPLSRAICAKLLFLH
jgi:hypothetical protein